MTPLMLPNWASGPQNQPSANVAVSVRAGSAASIDGSTALNPPTRSPTTQVPITTICCFSVFASFRSAIEYPSIHCYCPQTRQVFKTCQVLECRAHIFSCSKSFLNSPYPSSSSFSTGMNLRAAEFIQYRSPVGSGPSGKTCPR